ncbi:S8 family serine peptidase [Leptothoe sp. EHU-05/26/07-4]|uniref:Peptidase S8 n=1 Tax=Adonisia turfae CCMR0081 TaxID=2292702 RepID=A0A6M0RUM1_9CYAN|nr:S8 family serine peptidase [Adonisia turfae]NEZ59856.1 peptidase S8 [Adonisia turfae CCMR0081]
MKPHILLTLVKDIAPGQIPYWEDVAQRKATAPIYLTPTVDRVTENYGCSFQMTREYRPARETHWDHDERESKFDRTYRLILQQNKNIPPGLIDDIAVIPNVETVTAGRVATAELPQVIAKGFSLTTGMRSRQAIYLPEAHDYSQGDSQITIAVLDTGVDLDHPELTNVLLPGADFVDIIDGAGKFLGDYLGYDEDPDDEVGHGTHVAGIVSGQGIKMPLGVVPKCKILPVRVLGALKRGSKKVGAGLVDNINTGIKWAIDNGANVINMSLGIEHTGGGLPHEDVVNYARRKGVSIVAASGNDGKEQLYYPGALPHVIAVGALDESGNVAPFSTYGKQVDFVAPGTDIYSTYIGNDYGFSTGTSHASPFVAGAIALLKSYARQHHKANLSDQQVKYLLKHTADKLDKRFKHPKAGFGKLNLLDALRLLDYKFAA